MLKKLCIINKVSGQRSSKLCVCIQFLFYFKVQKWDENVKAQTDIETDLGHTDLRTHPAKWPAGYSHKNQGVLETSYVHQHYLNEFSLITSKFFYLTYVISNFFLRTYYILCIHVCWWAAFYWILFLLFVIFINT